MRKRIAIFFLLVFSVTMTEASQLLKIPLLVEHYIDHSEKNADHTLFGFIKAHYLLQHEDDGDEQEDSNLPFKTLNTNTVSLNFIPPHNPGIIFPGSAAADYPLLAEPFIFSDPLFGVFHPPRPA